MTTQSLPESITDRYDIAEHIGAGGQGAAYRAVDRASGRMVALKVRHGRVGSDSEADGGRPFTREVATLERLAGTPGVMPIEAHGVADGRGWFATELFPSTVADRLRSLGRLDAHEVRQVGAHVATALAAVHDAGVLHRDLKPSNVFLRADGEPVLGDFGVARIVDEQTLTASQGASLGFMAPETIERGETSTSSDLYSLGATLYALLEGHPPHASDSTVEETPIGLLIRRITSGEPPELSDRVPADLAATVTTLMAGDPDDRPGDAAAVAAALVSKTGLRSKTGLGARPTRSAPEPSSAPRPRFIRLPVLIALAGLVVIAGWLVVTRISPPDQTASPATISTVAPTTVPTVAPTIAPTTVPTVAPTMEPTIAPTTVPTMEPTVAPTVTPTTAPAASPVGAGVTACSVDLPVEAILLCEPFDSPVDPADAWPDDWELLEDPAAATVELANGQVFFVRPDDATAGGSYVERTVGALPPDTDVVVRVQARLLDGPQPGDDSPGSISEWWQNILVVGDESQNTWSAGVQWLAGGYAVDLSYADLPDNFGGVLGDNPADLGKWTCIEMVLGRSDGRAPELFIDDVAHAMIPDPAAVNYGDGFVVRAGPVWLDPAPEAPTLVIDELVVATERMGCAAGG